MPTCLLKFYASLEGLLRPQDMRTGSAVSFAPKLGDKSASTRNAFTSHTWGRRQEDLMLPWLPKKGRQRPPQGQEVVILGNVAVPAGVKKVLQNGPKVCEHPNLDKVELLGLVRGTVGRAKEDEVGLLVQEGVQCLPQDIKTARQRSNAIVAGLRRADARQTPSADTQPRAGRYAMDATGRPRCTAFFLVGARISVLALLLVLLSKTAVEAVSCKDEHNQDVEW
ncbi:hypothetical protein HPB52_011512 [Rhipicephalus sanguineus]|uniref:Uncharacterized protein n=1 Tax=Rhipicephalus sanguineus TaxID=34632 RepID=A0A9D4QAI6_RHISA|nr:hypothetical protein HPB52_011512 [Rhipicephalus sanguineus]